MNRPRPLETARAGYGLPGPVGTALSIFVGAAALIVVGSALGKGLDPPSAPADLVAVEGRTSGAQGGGEGLIGALSAALRALGVVQPEAEAIPTAVPEVVQTVALEVVEEPDPLPPPAVAVEGPSSASVAEQRLVAPDPPVVAVAFPETLAFEPIMADDAAEDTGEVPLAPQEAASRSSAALEPPPPPPPPSAPPRAPVAPSGLAAPSPVVAQPTRRPTRTPVPPTSTRQPRPSATPKPSATPHPTAAPAFPTRVLANQTRVDDVAIRREDVPSI